MTATLPTRLGHGRAAQPLARLLAGLMAGLMVGLLVTTAALAHQSGNSYLDIRVDAEGMRLQVDLPVQDLPAIVRQPGTSASTPAAPAALQPLLTEVVRRQLVLAADEQALPLAFVSQWVVLHHDGLYLRQTYAAPPLPPAARALRVYYDFFKQGERGDKGQSGDSGDHGDSVARAYAKLSLHGIEQGSVFDARQAAQRFALGGYARAEGLARLRPTADMRWQAARPAMAHALWVVSAFTVAHSITLTAAALDSAPLPERWVEAGIALSIIAAALLNLTDRGQRCAGALAFGFGLIHGLGFANGLREIGLAHGHFIETLLAFNLGVEAGQLAVLAAIGLALWPWLRRDWVRLRLALWGSALVLPISGLWLAESAPGGGNAAAWGALKSSPGRPKTTCPHGGRAGRSPALGALSSTSSTCSGSAWPGR